MTEDEASLWHEGYEQGFKDGVKSTRVPRVPRSSNGFHPKPKLQASAETNARGRYVVLQSNHKLLAQITERLTKDGIEFEIHELPAVLVRTFFWDKAIEGSGSNQWVNDTYSKLHTIAPAVVITFGTPALTYRPKKEVDDMERMNMNVEELVNG